MKPASWQRGVPLRVTGTSMMPTLRPGDVIWVRHQEAAEAGPGDIVLFTRCGWLFIHRVVRTVHSRGECCWITRGDGLPQNDPPVSREELLGRVTAVLRPKHRLRRLRRVLWPAFGYRHLPTRFLLRWWAGQVAEQGRRLASVWRSLLKAAGKLPIYRSPKVLIFARGGVQMSLRDYQNLHERPTADAETVGMTSRLGRPTDRLAIR